MAAPKGHPRWGGRKKGPIKAIILGIREALAPEGPKLIKALIDCTTDPDGKVRIKAIELGLAYLHGRPAEAPAPAEPDRPRELTPQELEAAELAATQGLN